MGNLSVHDFPPEVQAALGPVQRLTHPPQGLTSTVAIAETTYGVRAIKRAVGTLYGRWLAQEHRVLDALAAQPLPIPKPYAFVRRDTGIVPERWLVMDYVPGQTLSTVLSGNPDAAIRTAL